MKNLIIKISIFILVFTGCDSEYSPYQDNTNVQDLNNKAITKIKEANLTYPFSVALISDTHDFYNQLDAFKDYINERQDEYSFVINGGDFTDAGLQLEFDRYTNIRSKINLPVVDTIGNHDAITNGILIFKNTFGDFDYRFETSKIHFIVFNNNTWEFGDKPVNLDWLENELKTASEQVAIDGGQIFVVHHVNYNADERYTPAEILRYENLMKDYNVSMSINGHNHGYGEFIKDGFLYLTIGSISYKAFMKLTITGPNKNDYILERIFV